MASASTAPPIVARFGAVPDALDETIASLAQLVDEHFAQEDPEIPDEGADNFRCEGCVACRECRFCGGCTRCVECTYCEACEDCEGCTQCRACEGCIRTTHAEHSADCAECSYVTLCLDCESCVHCFACVGLSGEEFCILNEKHPKAAYFKRVAILRAALAERVAAGWRPPWATEDDAESGDESELEAGVQAQLDSMPPAHDDPGAPVLPSRELGPLRNPPLPPPPPFPTPPPHAPRPREFSALELDARRRRNEDTSPRWVAPQDDESRPIDADRLLWSDAIPQVEQGEEGPTRPIALTPSPTLTRAGRPRRPSSDEEQGARAATLRSARRPPRRER